VAMFFALEQWCPTVVAGVVAVVGSIAILLE
jgi:hypothetical protein